MLQHQGSQLWHGIAERSAQVDGADPGHPSRACNMMPAVSLPQLCACWAHQSLQDYRKSHNKQKDTLHVGAGRISDIAWFFDTRPSPGLVAIVFHFQPSLYSIQMSRMDTTWALAKNHLKAKLS
eukprot:5539810-Amphidinium_carterae.1